MTPEIGRWSNLNTPIPSVADVRTTDSQGELARLLETLLGNL